MPKKILKINIYSNHIPDEVNGPENEVNEIKKRTLESALLAPEEYPVLYKDHPITDEEFEDALNTIVTHSMQRQLHTITVDLDIHSKIIDQRNQPIRISLEELSAFFGGREVIIVGNKSETGCVGPDEENPIGSGLNG